MARVRTDNDKTIHASAQTAKGAINVNPAFDQIRRTNGEFKETVSTVVGGEIKNNRQGDTVVKNTTTYAGTVGYELTQQSASLLDKAIHGTAVDNSETDTDIAATGTGFTFPSGSLITGDWFKISGFTDSTIDGTYKASLVSVNDVTTTVAPVATESAGQSVTIESIKTTNAKDITYYTLQSRTLDESAAGDLNYKTFFDSVINSASLSIGEAGIIAGEIGFNIESKVTGTAAVSGQTDTTADSSDVLGSHDGLTTLYIDGVDSACSVKSLSIEMTNNYQPARSLSCKGEQYTYGDFTLSGSLATRSTTDNTFDWENKQIDGTAISISALFEWPDNKWLIIDITNAKLTEHSSTGGSNTIVSNEMSFAGQEDLASNSTIQLFKNFT